jgi:hypothetical protein
LVRTLEHDFSSLLSDTVKGVGDITKEIDGKDKEGGHTTPNPGGRDHPVAKLDLRSLPESERPYAETIAKDFANAGYGGRRRGERNRRIQSSPDRHR